MKEETIDDLFEASSVEFPEPQTVEQVEALFDYMVMALQARVSYSRSNHNIIDGRMVEDKLVKERTSEDITGMISAGGEYDSAFASFSCVKDREDRCRMTHIRFETIPGYSIAEHPEHDRKMWYIAKAVAAEYFAELTSQQELPLDE